jgi:hypothetical protein
MKLGLKGPIVVKVTIAWLIGVPFMTHLGVSQEKPQLAEEAFHEEAFHNIQVLCGIPVDDFMVGVMSAALGFDCSECHTGAATDGVDWAADTQRKVIARRTVAMVAAIKKDNFTGRQTGTCWSCHRGRDKLAVTPTMDTVYGTPSLEADDVFQQASGQCTADQILDKYIQAVTAAQRLAGLTSFIAKGTSVGFGGFSGGGQAQILTKAPDHRTTLIEFEDAPDRGDAIRTFNVRVGWIKTPLAVLKEYQLSRGNLAPGWTRSWHFQDRSKKNLKNWRVSLSTTIEAFPGPSSQTSQQPELVLGSHDVQMVQADRPNGVIATLYFDTKSGLLLRGLRYSRSPIGRVPTQIDYFDYRDVNGIKIPFRLTFAWLDGDSIELKDVQTNVPIEDERFGRPNSIKPE